MKKRTNLVFLLLLMASAPVFAQSIIWTGNAANNDFFDEANWNNVNTNSVPSPNTIDAGVAINLPLVINNVSNAIVANGSINLGTGSLSITKARINAPSLTAGSVVVNEDAYIDLSNANPLQASVQINLTSGISWVRTTNAPPINISLINATQIKVNNQPSVHKVNLRLDNYYAKGCVIRPIIANTSPLQIYDGINLQGNSAAITINTIHSATAIAGSMNNISESFVLKKGYMVTFADENDGTGKSKNYIASEEDLIINILPKTLQNAISFIRVLPWNWVGKRGIGGTITGLDETWFYRWANVGESTIDREYAPMSFGLSGADDAADIVLYQGKYKATHVMGFNEPDNCTGQGGTNGGCIITTAVATYKNLMKTGLRMVSPSGTEGAGTGWLKDFNIKAKEQNVRIDVIAVHWYDWGSNPVVNTNPSAVEVFNRFKTYLTTIHNLYGLPIWITEFNANPNRSGAINLAFMKLALPYLDTLDYVERYAWFQPSSGVANYFDATGNYTEAGLYYKNFASAPAIPEATINADNNLNLVDYPNVARNKIATANSTYSTFSPAAAIDGNLLSTTSKWVVNFGASDDINFTSLPAWYAVDLQGSFLIDAIRIIEETRALKNFRFEIWDTTINAGSGGWTSVLNVVNNPSTPLTTYKTFATVATTRVRLFITAHNSADYLRLLELEVYGIPNVVLNNNEVQKSEFSIFPNPVNEEVLNIKGEQNIETVEVFSVLGKKVTINFDNKKVFVSNLPAGIYFIKINNTKSLKFIKK